MKALPQYRNQNAWGTGAAAAGQWLRRGVIDYARHFGSREFLRNNINVTSIGGAIAVIDQIWLNGRMSLPEIIRTRVIVSIVDMAGAGDVTVSGHGEWLRLWGITPETPDWKRRLIEWPVIVAGVGVWNMVQYAAGGVAASHYWRSVFISTLVGVLVQIGVLRANAILNNYATNNPRFCHSLPTRWSRVFGCAKLGAPAKRKLYWLAILALNAFMVANWIWGVRLRHFLLR